MDAQIDAQMRAMKKTPDDREPDCEATNLRFWQDADGYDPTHDPQSLHVELLDGCAVLRTDRWCCSPGELRMVADKIEKMLTDGSV